MRRAACETTVRLGMNRDGAIVFEDIHADYLIGAYADIADRVVGKGSYVGAGPYAVPAVRIVARSVLSHTVPSTAFRGFGAPQVNWAVESTIDEAADALGLDRLEVRLRNLARKGQAFIPFDTPCDGDWADSVREAATRIGWGSPVPEGRGRGIAVGIKSGPTTGLSTSIVRLLADGSVVVYAGTSDMGQGARTVFAQLASQELGAPLDWVTVVMGDTAVVPVRPADLGVAVDRADGQRRAGGVPRDPGQAPRRWRRGSTGSPRPTSSCRKVVVRLPDGTELPVREVLIAGLGRLGGEVTGLGEARKEADPDHPLGGSAAFFEFNCTAIEASVDRETGDITIHRHVTVSDVGKALNPLQVTMQDEGAAIMGLGHTLMEHYLFDDEGRIRNLGAIDYRIPTSMDLPGQARERVHRARRRPGPVRRQGDERGRAAVRGAGRGLGDPAHATGVRIRDLPLSPGAGLAGAPGREERDRARDLGLRVRRPARGVAGGARPAARRQGREPGDDGGRPRAAGAAGVHDLDRGLPGIPRLRLARGAGRRGPGGDGGPGGEGRPAVR